LQEQGKLLISDPLSKYIPEFEKTKIAVQKENESEYEIVDANRQITIRDLLTHTAGIGYGWGLAQKEWEDAGILGWYFADRDEPISTTVGRMASLPMSEQPGQKFVYGYGTDILGVVIERASGMPLDAFIELNILKLLGMEDTYFYLPPQKANRLSVVYSATNAGGITKAPDPGKMIGQGAYLEGPRKSFSGGAGLLSTAEDFARFLLMMFNEGELNGHRLLAPSTIKLMTSNHLRDIPYSPGRGFGLGFEVVLDAGARGIPGSVGEYGWGGAYGSNYWVDPEEKLIIVYFKQLIPTNGLDDAGKLRSLIYQAIVD
jgi:CubicO group peptidase (beta-lactamase class C family)